MLRRPPRSTLFPYHDALPIWPRNRLAGLDGDSAARELFDAPRRAIRLEGNALDPGRGVSGHGFRRWIEVNDLRSEEHTSELQSLAYLVCRLLLEKKKTERH